MNVCFQDFKDKTDSCAKDIFLGKVHDHSLESKNHDIERGVEGKVASLTNNSLPAVNKKAPLLSNTLNFLYFIIRLVKFHSPFVH